MDNSDSIAEVLERIQEGRATSADLRRYSVWCDSFQKAQKEIGAFPPIEQKMLEGIRHEIQGKKTVRLVYWKRWLPYAAAVILALTTVFLVSKYRSTPAVQHAITTEILPGGNKAKLTLADGQVINLSEAREGIIVSNENISYLDHSGNIVNLQNAVNDLMLSTPNGGTYRVTLPDGTRVWLNAASTLRYPSKFTKDIRKVMLTGEAYFEVAPNRNIPFLVETQGQLVRVLGTQFNISAYEGEQVLKTTLVEGSVELENLRSAAKVKLRPGEQGVTNGSQTAVQPVNTESFTAWKDGLFLFYDTPLTEAMNQLSRWYDIEIVYEDHVSPTYFFGEMSRDKPLRQVLDVLKEGGVNFRIENDEKGQRLVVMP